LPSSKASIAQLLPRSFCSRIDTSFLYHLSLLAKTLSAEYCTVKGANPGYMIYTRATKVAGLRKLKKDFYLVSHDVMEIIAVTECCDTETSLRRCRPHKQIRSEVLYQ
jgi:hypothetical protein